MTTFDARIKTTLSSEIYSLAKRAIKIAIEYKNLTGRKLGITGEIGEILTCKELGLILSPKNSTPGFDATDKTGKIIYQIKTQQVADNRGRIGKFSKHNFDYALIVRLKCNYEIEVIYQVKYTIMKRLINNAPNRNPSFNNILRLVKKNKATQVYPK